MKDYNDYKEEVFEDKKESPRRVCCRCYKEIEGIRVKVGILNTSAWDMYLCQLHYERAIRKRLLMRLRLKYRIFIKTLFVKKWDILIYYNQRIKPWILDKLDTLKFKWDVWRNERSRRFLRPKPYYTKWEAFKRPFIWIKEHNFIFNFFKQLEMHNEARYVPEEDLPAFWDEKHEQFPYLFNEV